MNQNGTDPRHVRAQRLRDAGLSYNRIASALEVSNRTIIRWLNPDGAERDRVSARSYKERNRDALRERNATYQREHRGRCLTCGGLMGIGCSEDGECQSCRSRGREWRRRRIAALWREGLTLKQIAADLDSTPESIGVEMSYMRRDGWDVPHRYKVAA